MRLFHLITSLSLVLSAAHVFAAAPSDEIVKKVIAQGVPADAMQRLVKFMYENEGRSFNQDTYSCASKEANPNPIKPCEEEKRSRSSQTVTLASPEYVSIVDYTVGSTTRRFFLINVKTGDVAKYYVSHGIGSGNTNFATKFSNTKDSRQTSLGIYLVGGTYNGKYGETLRLYGLQSSNDQAYNRDIVLHGAWYVGEDFINMINDKTKLPYGRLGHSWGCPAVSTSIITKLIPILKNGGLVMHYHADLMDEALSGKEVFLPPVPTPKPELPLVPQEPTL